MREKWEIFICLIMNSVVFKLTTFRRVYTDIKVFCYHRNFSQPIESGHLLEMCSCIRSLTFMY